ncbi:hypothetical protein PENTCL1PPCAC_16894, partial [Pristionchus entomophagus]
FVSLYRSIYQFALVIEIGLIHRSIKSVKISVESRFDILVNNAGMAPTGFVETEDGHESTWHANHLGPVLLTELLLPLIEKSDEGRIVMVSSGLHKLVMYARELARRLKERGSQITVNSLHPGSIKTKLGRNFGFHVIVIQTVGQFFMKSCKEGAQTTLYLALSTEVNGESGEYYADCKHAAESANAMDDEACKKLYDYSLRTVGLT